MLRKFKWKLCFSLALGALSFGLSAQKLTLSEMRDKCWNMKRAKKMIMLSCRGDQVVAKFAKKKSQTFTSDTLLVGSTTVTPGYFNIKKIEQKKEQDSFTIETPVIEFQHISAPKGGVKVFIDSDRDSCGAINQRNAELLCRRTINEYCEDNTVDLGWVMKEGPVDITGMCTTQKMTTLDFSDLYNKNSRLMGGSK